MCQDVIFQSIMRQKCGIWTLWTHVIRYPTECIRTPMLLCQQPWLLDASQQPGECITSLKHSSPGHREELELVRTKNRWQDWKSATLGKSLGLVVKSVKSWLFGGLNLIWGSATESFGGHSFFEGSPFEHWHRHFLHEDTCLLLMMLSNVCFLRYQDMVKNDPEAALDKYGGFLESGVMSRWAMLRTMLSTYN